MVIFYNMEKNEVIKLKQDLLKELEEIESELSRFTTKNPVVKDDYKTMFSKPDQQDTLDEQAQNVTTYEQDMGVEHSLELRRKEIKETLEKIDTGVFGVCIKCSSPIEENRLKAMSVAKFCIACAPKK
jgi:RNA polymerase-binding transcription factor DksA